jgi:succinyl-diaminopimelate desuccinylase
MNYQAQIAQYFDTHQKELVEDVKRLVRIPSDRGAAQPGMPFGEGPVRALEAALQMAESYGFATKNYDNYVGTADLGPSEAGLDILAHLDVVPVANNWTVCDPFEPVELDGNLYGRGTADDKGPAVAALYAMRCVKELGVPLKRRVRWIVGTDEECGSSDIERYYATEPEAPMTFSPDASFPLINLEKGRLSTEITAQYAKTLTGARIVSLDSGFKSNVIPESALAVLDGLTVEQAKPVCEQAYERLGVDFTLSVQEGLLHLAAKGEGGHAAFPQGANNALTALLDVLAALPLTGGCADAVRALHAMFPHGDYLGQAAGVAMSDEVSGELTISLNMLSANETALTATFDSRVPVCGTQANVHDVLAARCAALGLSMTAKQMVAPHYVPGDSDFVRTLLKAYEDWTGNKGECLAIGGGTYVHELKNGVAFGCTMPGVDNREHGADEFAVISDLVTSGKIFAQAIIELCG